MTYPEAIVQAASYLAWGLVVATLVFTLGRAFLGDGSGDRE